ncbi:MAG: alanine--tRNA ligase [Armatimonadetes bacterium]|nr:alanine--tRNA ligase [Armatimonadota bacterium]
MKGAEIRQSFLDFFREHGHAIVDSAPVVPFDDPTLLFTNAGMNQFKPFFLGQATPGTRRVADTQKCIRVSGKHNDLEEVGYDTYHHTFFEMLGNWSFGDYYKREAIRWGWELLTKVWGLPRERLYATVFGGDDKLPADEEAERLWREETDIDPSHILRFGRADNFWMMGDTGPCGPCSEIHLDLTADASGGDLINKGSPRAMELWNLVFIQYNAEPDGSLRELPAKHVDTGMGFERACAVLECTEGGKDFSRPVSNYDTAVFRPILEALERLSGKRYTPGLSEDPVSVAMRVCADHIRMTAFAVADGALPSNEGRGYVVRRLLRRAARYGRKLDLHEPFLYQLVQVLEQSMGHVFPELGREREKIEKIVRAEEISFNQTLDRGIALFEGEIERLAHRGGRTFPGEVAFKLYDTYGFPVDLTEVMAREAGFVVDMPGYLTLMEEQRERARSAQARVTVTAEAEQLDLPDTPFVGFDTLEVETEVLAVLGKDKDLELVLHQTPFYAEMGGQVGDTGWIFGDADRLRVSDTLKREGVVVHRCTLEGGPRPQESSAVKAAVDVDRRLHIERHHTATHLLHHALREVLGKGVRQQGSLVAPDRLRFDFTHYEAVEPDELRTIERIINERILEDQGVSWFEIPISKKPDSVIAFFGDKYGDKVRVVKIGGRGEGRLPEAVFDGYSMELCGGTHTRRTGELGPFHFASEGAIAAGVRRVEAVCGHAALESIRRDLDILDRAAQRLGIKPDRLEERLQALLENQKDLERQLEQARQSEAAAQAEKLLTQQSRVGEVPVLASHIGRHSPDFLRLVADAIRPSFQGVAVLAGTGGGKVALLALVDSALVKKGYHAGNLVKEVARMVGGGGGGRPDMAEAGGRDPSRLPEALARVPELVRAQGKG